MVSARALISRVAKLEAARQAPQSPFEAVYGSLAAFEADTQQGIAEGRLDAVDMPIVIACIRRWHSDGVWRKWC